MGSMIYVIYSFIQTFQKVHEGRIIVSLTENDLREYLFPSVTICSKYKDGYADILPILWLRNWNDTGRY